MRKSLVFAGIFLVAAATVRSQRLIETLNTYATNFSQERVHLHFDKQTYAQGETIWFKAYLLDGIDPAVQSKNFYVDISDEKGNLLAHNVYPIVEATTNGQWMVPEDYPGKLVHIKAYTKWMLNFDSAFLYNKDIRIISTAPQPGVTVSKLKPELTFFPEGGDALISVVNKIAFKATDQSGLPVKVKGVIINDKGVKMDSLRVMHDGMGYFYLTPQPGETYSANWKDEKGNNYTTALRATRSTGINLQLQVSGTRRNITIQAAALSMGELDSIHMIGTMNQHVVVKASRKLESGLAKLTVPTAELPSGIMVMTIFDKTWKPLAERITYINNNEFTVPGEMEVVHWGLNKRARNEIRITIPDSIAANLSVAVTDLGIETDTSNTIISDLMLSSELKGRIHNAAYYFSSTNDIVSQRLDLVMLTNGWRRFAWKDIAENKFPRISYPRDTNYVHLAGRVYGISEAQLRDAGDVVLFLKPPKGELATAILPIKPSGVFEDPSVIVFDSIQVYYQFTKKRIIGGASVQFLESILPAFRYNTIASGQFTNTLSDTAGLQRHRNLAGEALDLVNFQGKVLGNVVVKSKLKRPMDELDDRYVTGLFNNNDGYQFDLLNDTWAKSALDIFQYLQSKVPGLTVTNSGGNQSITWRRATAQLYVDEMRADPSFVASIPVSHIAYIKVIPPPFFMNQGGSGGAVAIYTRKGDDLRDMNATGLSINKIRGYAELREFYSPNYSSFKPEYEKKDLRTTLYWNPQVRINSSNKQAVLTFYNNDVSKAFRVIIEGMSNDGKLIRLEQLME